MTTIRELVSDAFREGNITQVGDTPDGAQYLEAEKRLLSYIDSMWGAEVGENPTNTYYTDANQVIPRTPRVVVTEDVLSDIALPTSPMDGERFLIVDPSGYLSPSTSVTISSDPVTISGEPSVTLDTPLTSKHWFYRADKGEWVEVTSLTSDSESPFPKEFDDLLITWLAIRLNPRNGVATSEELLNTYRRMLKLFRARYSQTVHTDVEEGLLRMTGSSYQDGSYFARGR